MARSGRKPNLVAAQHAEGQFAGDLSALLVPAAPIDEPQKNLITSSENFKLKFGARTKTPSLEARYMRQRVSSAPTA